MFNAAWGLLLPVQAELPASNCALLPRSARALTVTHRGSLCPILSPDIDAPAVEPKYVGDNQSRPAAGSFRANAVTLCRPFAPLHIRRKSICVIILAETAAGLR